MSRQTKSSGSSLAELRHSYPALAGISERRALALVDIGLRAGYHPEMRALTRFAGQYAAERGCATDGPVQIGASTWAHRSADGRTQVWHRQPTAAEVRALTGRTSATSKRGRKARTSTTTSRPKNPAVARIERIFQ